MLPLKLLLLSVIGMVYRPTNPTTPTENNAAGDHLVPLKSMEYNVHIANTVAEIELIQHYHNNFEDFLETDFLFPASVDAAFLSLEVHVQGKLIKSVVKEKEEAKETYEKEKNEGKFVGYAGTEANAPDIMRIKIGNIPPKEDVKVIFRYAESIEVQANKYYRLIISSTLTPRYYSRIHPKEVAPAIQTTDENLYPWNIKVTIKASSKITEIKSPTHDIEQSLGDDHRTAVIIFPPNVVSYPKRNFVLLYKVEDLHLPATSLTRFSVQSEQNNTSDVYCLHLSFLPDLVADNADILNFDESAKFLPKYTRSYENQRGEFIFILDRSGSMGGNRIIKAREALATFILSLPSDSFFDIISFGSTFQSYSSGDIIKATQTAKEEAAKTVRTYDSDMGGTEIYEPMIEALLLRPPQPNYPRYIFLLTDGDVGNTESIVKLVENNHKLAVVNTMGIGSGASENLIKEVARAGRGKFEFVADNEDFTEKVQYMLTSTFIPVVDSIRLSYDEKSVYMASPNPIAHRFLTIGEIYHVFLFYSEASARELSVAALNLSYEHPQTKHNKVIQVEHSFAHNKSNNYIPRLGIYQLIRNIERYQRNKALNKSTALDSVIPVVDTTEEIDELLLNLSLHYQVLSEKTAFLVVSNETFRDENQTSRQVSVPNLESADYYKDADQGQGQSNSTYGGAQYYYSPSAGGYAMTNGRLLVCYAMVIIFTLTLILL